MSSAEAAPERERSPSKLPYVPTAALDAVCELKECKQLSSSGGAVLNIADFPAHRVRRRSVRGGIAVPTLELPAVSASKEFLDALFDKHNIDGEQISSKSVVDNEFRQTLGSPQNKQLVEAISHAIVSHAHSCIGSHGTEHGWFDERQHPLAEGAPPPQPSLAAVQGWLWTILDALKLDPECLILSLVLLERALSKSELRLTPFTWRPCVLCALVVSSKTWYDKAVFNIDFSERLPSYNLAHINTMETEFLSALDYRATVSLSLYAKYFFALQDVLGTSNTRRSTWTAGESTRPA